MPPNLGEHKKYYSGPLNSSVSSEQKNSFQPKSQHYRCKVTLTMEDNDALEFYANSFTWLNSKETYLTFRKSLFKSQSIFKFFKS